MDDPGEREGPALVEARSGITAPGFARTIALTLLAAVTATVGPGFAKPGLAAEPLHESQGAATGPLDGRAYAARIVRATLAEQSREPGDELMFSNGMFGSMLCRRFNFSDAPYWIRREGDRIHFLAEMTSPTDGKMVWKGTIRGDTLEGTMRWTKERWYWTIDTEHKIRGTLQTEAHGRRLPGD